MSYTIQKQLFGWFLTFEYDPMEIHHFEEPWKIIKGPWKTDRNMLKTWKWPEIFLLKDTGIPATYFEFIT